MGGGLRRSLSSQSFESHYVPIGPTNSSINSSIQRKGEGSPSVRWTGKQPLARRDRSRIDTSHCSGEGRTNPLGPDRQVDRGTRIGTRQTNRKPVTVRGELRSRRWRNKTHDTDDLEPTTPTSRDAASLFQGGRTRNRRMSRDMSSTPPQKGGPASSTPPAGSARGPPPQHGPYHPPHPSHHGHGHPSPPAPAYMPPPGHHPTSYQYPGSSAGGGPLAHHPGHGGHHPSPPGWGHPPRHPQPPPGYVLVPVGQASSPTGSGGRGPAIAIAGGSGGPDQRAAGTPEGNGMNGPPPSHGGGYRHGGGYPPHAGYHHGGGGYGYQRQGGGTPPPGLGSGKISPPRTYMEGKSVRVAPLGRRARGGSLLDRI